MFSRIRDFSDHVFDGVLIMKMMLWLEFWHPSYALARGLEGSECRLHVFDHIKEVSNGGQGIDYMYLIVSSL